MTAQDAYRVRVSVKNNLILSRIEATGHYSIHSFCAAHDITYSVLHRLLSMKMTPAKKSGDWRRVVVQLATVFKCLPDELFTETQLAAAMPKAWMEVEMSETQMLALASSGLVGQIEDGRPDVAMMKTEAGETLAKMIEQLTPREQTAVRCHFGMDGESAETLDELGRKLGGVQRERARQILAKALRKLRHPGKRVELQGALSSFNDPVRS